VRVIFWTDRARADLGAIRAFISRDSARYAEVVVARLIAAVERLAYFPEAGRAVPEFVDPAVREIISRPYRIVYRLVGGDTLHILAVHHGARRFPTEL
jgi:toxin ParE1/3/4